MNNSAVNCVKTDRTLLSIYVVVLYAIEYNKNNETRHKTNLKVVHAVAKYKLKAKGTGKQDKDIVWEMCSLVFWSLLFGLDSVLVKILSALSKKTSTSLNLEKYMERERLKYI